MNVAGLALFAFVSSITPGPNNVMLWASGINYGFRRTFPHMLGIAVGFVTLLVSVALGLGSLFQRFTWLSPLLRVLGSAYLLYLAYRILVAGRTEQRASARPLSLFEAAAFQFVNPKAWVMGITAASSFIEPEQNLFVSAALLGAVFGAINLPCIATWTAAGSAIGRLLTDDRRRRVVNAFLALLLVGTVYLINT